MAHDGRSACGSTCVRVLGQGHGSGSDPDLQVVILGVAASGPVVVVVVVVVLAVQQEVEAKFVVVFCIVGVVGAAVVDVVGVVW